MQFSVVALAALAATASAWSNDTVVYTTEVHTAYTTYCPASTQLTFNGITYTVTASQTLTITNCPCTIVKPVTTSAVVKPSPPVYANTTVPATTTPVATKTPVGTTSVKSNPSPTPSTITASGANKAFVLSGASLAGLLGVAAYLL